MKQKITELLKEAMKERNDLKVRVYRSLKADIETAEHNGCTNILSIIVKAAKKRDDAFNQYMLADRPGLALEEKYELEIITQLLPKEPTKLELFEAIGDAVVLFGKNMGEIIKIVKFKYPTVDGKKLADMVKNYLLTVKS